MNQWYQFEGPDEDERGDEIEALEKTALDAIKAIVKLGETKSDKTLIIGVSLRKISTVSGSHAQTLSIRSMTVRKGERI